MLNPGNGTISVDGKLADLTKNELKILQILFEHQGHVVSRESIMTKLWESDSFVDDNTLTVNITRTVSYTHLYPYRSPSEICDRQWPGYRICL